MIEHNGVYIVFEGPDFVGKTTIATMVENNLKVAGKDPILTKHPGATPLGKHLRKLVKTPQIFEDKEEEFSPPIKVDPTSAQILMMVDQICFINTILSPQLAENGMVLADRSNFISMIAYGLSEGLKLSDLHKLFQLASSPAPDEVFILQAPWEVRESRMQIDDRGGPTDRFDSKGIEFHKKVADVYDNLLTINPEILVLLANFVPTENITYVDATKPAAEIAVWLTARILEIASQKLDSQ